ncbi:LysR family transcriptional regulator [Sulfitobacter aestuariivivens]|uniref:LysR family transcriptional regulator n=1 Tax=Sulfitobacter aestuariivivens TaxID=2766981 RepID=UPI0036138C21
MKRITLETFIALAHLRHFGKVASQLNTTQSTVSARIAGLERDLGAELFARSSNSVALTPKGRELLTHATEVIASMDRMSRAVGVDPYREGTLRLGVSETLASTILPGFIGAFSAQYPNSSVEIIVNNTGFQRDQLVERGLDLALLMGPVSHALIANVPLLELPMIWAVAPDHPLAALSEVTVEALAAHPILSYATNSRPYIELVESLRLAGIRTPDCFRPMPWGPVLRLRGRGWRFVQRRGFMRTTLSRLGN